MWTKFQEYQFNGDKAVWYEAKIKGVEVNIFKSDRSYDDRKYQVSLTYGPVKIRNRAHTLVEAKKIAVKLVTEAGY